MAASDSDVSPYGVGGAAFSDDERGAAGEADTGPQVPMFNHGFLHGNEMTLFERRRNKLGFYQPMFAVARTEMVPARPTDDMLAIRAQETLAYGRRRMTETRKMKHEFTDRIKAMQERIKREELERLGPKAKERLRWWHKKTTVELRDPLKCLKFNNLTFKAEDLMMAKDVVILELTGCRLGDEQMSWISAFAQQSYTLRRLFLQANNITVEGCRELFLGIRSSKTLMDIDLSMNPIGDEGVGIICNALSENARNSKVYKLNVSTCQLTPGAAFHLARLIRDFKPLQCLLAWRNNLGCPTPSKLAGIANIFDELRSNSTLRLVDLSCNTISDADAAQHANAREAEIRRLQALEIEKTLRAQKIEKVQKEIREKRKAAVWDDEKVQIATMEKELEQERSKMRVAVNLELRSRTREQKAEMEVREHIKAATGVPVVECKVLCRLILTGNAAVQPNTLKRLSAFYNLEAESDATEWALRRRRYDDHVVARRKVGEEYTAPRDVEEYDSHNVCPWDKTFDVERENARRAELSEWRQEELERKNNAQSVKFDKFKLTGPPQADVPPPPGTKRRVVGATIKIASHVNDRVRDLRPEEVEAERRRAEAEKAAAIKTETTVTVKKVVRTVPAEQSEEEPEVVVVRKGTANAASAATATAATTTTAGRPAVPALPIPKVVPVAPHQRQPSQSDVADSSASSGPASARSPRGGLDDSERDVGAAAAYDDFTAGDDTDTAEPAWYEVELDDSEAMQEKLRQRMAELRATIEQRSAAAASVVVAAAAGLAGSGGYDSEASHGGTARSSVRNTPRSARGDAQAPVVVRATAPAASAPASGPPSAPTSARDRGANASDNDRQPQGEDTTAAVAPAAAAAEAAAAAVASHPATAIVLLGIEQCYERWAEIRQMSEVGSPDDAHLRRLEARRKDLGDFKMDWAARLAAATAATGDGADSRAPLPEAEEATAASFVDDLVKETDVPRGNAELLRAFVAGVALAWPVLIDERGLASVAACDSSLAYLHALLSVPGVRVDVLELASSCFFNQMARVPMTLALFEHPAAVDFASVCDELGPMWQEFFEDVAAKRRAIPREDRTRRGDLLRAMLATSCFTIDFETEAADGQTALSRACNEADEELVIMMVGTGRIANINLLKSDGTTALMQAVLGNSPKVVSLLLDSFPSIDVNVVGDNGSAFDLAVGLARDPLIAELLKRRGAKASGKKVAQAPAPKKVKQKVIAPKAPAGKAATKAKIPPPSASGPNRPARK